MDTIKASGGDPPMLPNFSKPVRMTTAGPGASPTVTLPHERPVCFLDISIAGEPVEFSRRFALTLDRSFLGLVPTLFIIGWENAHLTVTRPSSVHL